MGRFATPLLFLAAGAFVLWHNATYNDRVLMIPGVEMLYPAAQGDPDLQGRISGFIFLGLGGIFLLWALWKKVNQRGDRYQN